MCTLETTIRNKYANEDDLIDNCLQNQYLATMNIDGLKEESSLRKPICSQDNPWAYFFIVGSKENIIKAVETSPSKTLKMALQGDERGTYFYVNSPHIYQGRS